MLLLLSVTYLYTQADQVADVTVGGDDQIIYALIALIATSIGALVYTIKNNTIGKEIAKDASEANRAVDNPKPGDTRLYEMVARIEAKQDEFDRKWGNLPADVDDAVGLASVLHEIHRQLAENTRKIDLIASQLHFHDEKS